ncbi:MAG: Hint domain-containing protein [Pseudomonadota bacterium]
MSKTHYHINFNGFHAGDKIDDELQDQGITISATDLHGNPKDAMIFDTSHPTGGDDDLATDTLGNVLIISEDGDSSDPDDEADGGIFTIDFENEAKVKSLTFLDIEESAWVKFFDAHGNLIKTVDIHGKDDNEIFTKHFNVDGVQSMMVILNGSGAIDNLKYEAEPVAQLDGIVEGTDDGELIDEDYLGDPDGDRIDNNDAILPGEDEQDDIVFAEGGNDTIESGKGDDDIFAGSGDDSVVAGKGDDIIRGGAGDDTVYGGTGNDTIFGDDGAPRHEIFKWSNEADFGNDVATDGFTQDTGAAEITFDFTTSNDHQVDTQFETTRQNTDDLDPKVGDRSSLESVLNGDHNSATYTWSSSRPLEDVEFRINDIDGDGRVVVRAYDPHGNPIQVALSDAGSGLKLKDDDHVPGAETAKSKDDNYRPDDAAEHSVLVTIPGPVSRWEVDHEQDGDNNTGVNFTDIVFNIAPDPGAPGDDSLVGGDGADVIFGQDGSDTIIGGAGADKLSGGDDRDVFKAGDVDENGDPVDPAENAGSFIGDTVDGGTGGDDFDTLDLTGTTSEGGSLEIIRDGRDPDGDSDFGRVLYFDDEGNLEGQLTFKEIEDIIVCFTPGTAIATPRGERAVESLKPGDRVITRDNGIQEIAWTGARTLSPKELARAQEMRPVLVKAGALGHGLPERDIIVSPQHRMLMASDKTQLYFEEREVLVAAKHLVGMDGVTRLGDVETTYVHFMCESHEVVLSNGAWTETFQPGDYTLGSMGRAARDEIFALFPELKTHAGLVDYVAARKSLKRHEAALLIAS